MGKSVYSLVMDDEIIEAVDRAAYQMGTSRSNLINQILAQQLSCTTPEMRMKKVFSQVEQLMAERENFQVQFQSSDAIIYIRSALSYKYRPTVRYTLELYRNSKPLIGELRVTMRTQSKPLIALLNGFYECWQYLENALIGGWFPKGVVPAQSDGSGKYIRQFLTPEGETRSTEELAQALSDYIQLFDGALKLYFAEDEPKEALSQMERQYRHYMKTGTIL